MSLFPFSVQNREKKISEKIIALFRPSCTELETERLLLTAITPDHAEDMYMYSKDPDVSRYLTWSAHSSLKETERYIKLLGKKYASGAFRDYGLILKETGRMIGTCGYTSADDSEETVEIGYVLAQDMWGKGLASEAAYCVAKYAADTLGAKKICAKMMDGNTASMNVMKKLGMTLEGTYRNSMFVKGEYKTIHVFSVLSENLKDPTKKDLPLTKASSETPQSFI